MVVSAAERADRCADWIRVCMKFDVNKPIPIFRGGYSAKVRHAVGESGNFILLGPLIN